MSVGFDWRWQSDALREGDRLLCGKSVAHESHEWVGQTSGFTLNCPGVK